VAVAPDGRVSALSRLVTVKSPEPKKMED